jgi:hypothetical protein
MYSGHYLEPGQTWGVSLFWHLSPQKKFVNVSASPFVSPVTAHRPPAGPRPGIISYKEEQ